MVRCGDFILVNLTEEEIERLRRFQEKIEGMNIIDAATEAYHYIEKKLDNPKNVIVIPIRKVGNTNTDWGMIIQRVEDYHEFKGI